MSSSPDDPAVTVVIPTASVNEWLDIAVESVIDQLGPRDRLAVVHDGVEPDPERAWTTHPSVVVVHHPTRQGVSRACLAGIRATENELIARLDADDVSRPGRIAAQRAYLRDNPDVVVVGTRARTIDPAGAVIGDFPVQAGDRVRGRLIAENVVVNSSAMFRRDIFDRVGGYDPRYAMGEDYHLWLRMAHHGEVTVLDQVFVDYRIHRHQAMRRVSQLGPHVPEVLRQQRSLARLIRAPRLRSAVQSTRWLAIQVAMAGRVVIGNLALRLRPAP